MAKVFFLPSLVEGKNRARAEALCSNVPVVAFNNFNLAARGGEPVLPEGAGLAVDLDPQDAARGLANAVANYGDFAPRESYLRTGGRMNFFWECLLSFKYFCDQIPGNTVIEQANWLNRAIKSNYGLSLTHFLYHDHSTNPFAKKNGLKSLDHAVGAIDIKNLFMSYLTRFASHTSR